MQEIGIPLVWNTSESTTSGWLATGDVSNTNLYSQPIDVRRAEQFSVQCLFATGGTLDGSIKLQASNSDPKVESDGTPGPLGSTMTWTDIASATAAVAAAGSKLIALTSVPYRWVRVVWTETSPTTGSVVGNVCKKGSN